MHRTDSRVVASLSVSRLRLSLLAGMTATLAAVASILPVPARAQSSPFFQPFSETLSPIQYKYYSAGECVAAVARTGLVARRASSYRTEGWEDKQVETDTVLTVQREVAAACAKHLKIESVPVPDLPDLVRLYWYAGDQNAMSRTIARRITIDQTDSARAVTYQKLLTRFMSGAQRDMIFVTKFLLPALDSLSSLGAQKARFQIYVALAKALASSRLPDAWQMADIQIDNAIQEFERMPRIVQVTLVDTIGPLFKLSAATATEIGDTARTNALLTIARKLLPRLPDGAGHVHSTEAMVRRFGMRAPPMTSDFVLGAPANATNATWPRPGRWTLIAPLPFSGNARQFYKNLHQTFGDTLDIVFVMATRGFWRPHGPLEPKAEADLAYDYVNRRWGIPAVLLVEESTFRTLPDGRREVEGSNTPGIYGGSGIVIDPAGTIRAMVHPMTMVRFDMILRSLIKKQVAERTQ